MNKPVLNVEQELDLMIEYQNALESKSVIVKNSPRDEFRFSLFEIVEPYPTYNEYLHGNEFDEGQLIKHSASKEEMKKLQAKRKVLYFAPAIA